MYKIITVFIFLILILSSCSRFLDIEEPYVINTVPENDSSNINPDIKIKIKFNEAMNQNSVKKNSALSDQYNNKINLEYKWSDFDNLICSPEKDLNSGLNYIFYLNKNAEDIKGNNLVKDYKIKFTTKGINGIPEIINIHPSDHSTDNNPDTKIIITFNLPVEISSFKEAFSFYPQNNHFINSSDSAHTFTISFSEHLEYNTKYSINISTLLKAQNNNQLQVNYSSTFYIGSDLTQPAVYDLRSSSNFQLFYDSHTTGLEKNEYFKIYFSKEMNKNSVQQALSFTPSVTGEFSWSNNICTFVPNQDLNIETRYKIILSENAKDIYNNNLSKKFISSFTINGYKSSYTAVTNIFLSNIIIYQNYPITVFNSKLSELGFVFNKPMKNISLINNLSIYKISGSGSSGVYIESYDFGTDQKTIKINLDGLDAGNIYRIRINGGISGALDIYDCYLENDFYFYFET